MGKELFVVRKSELLHRLQAEYLQWEALLDEIGPARMDQPGVNGEWSMKDIVAHLTVWNHWLVARMQVAQHGEPEPPPPWPSHLKSEDEINAWIYESNCGRTMRAVLDESHQGIQQLLTVIEGLPDDVRIDYIEPKFHLVWMGDERFHDDHEPHVRAWLALVEGE